MAGALGKPATLTVKRAFFYPPLWFLLNLVSAFTIAWSWPTPMGLPRALQSTGVALGVLGAALAVGAAASLQRHRTAVLPFRQPTTLLDRGIFRLSRNPIYLGEAFILIGVALRLGEYLPFLIPGLFLFGLNANVIPWEEGALRSQFGEAFDRYRQRTRRWL